MPDGLFAATRANLLRQARDRLEWAERCEQWGVAAMDFALQASVKLQAAGLPELAAVCADEWLFDIAAVLAEVEREMRG